MGREGGRAEIATPLNSSNFCSFFLVSIPLALKCASCFWMRLRAHNLTRLRLTISGNIPDLLGSTTDEPTPLILLTL